LTMFHRPKWRLLILDRVEGVVYFPYIFSTFSV
jgi:hypothetical protein